MSCYAIFKGWLLLSQPPHCQRNFTSSLALNMNLGTLTGDLGCCPFDQWSFAPMVLLPKSGLWYSEFDRNNEISPYLSLPVLYPQMHISRRQPKSCFGENQLFPGSISFSLLTTSHPNALYDVRVRASMRLSTHFTLLMVSSPGFGSYISYQRAINTRFPFSSTP